MLSERVALELGGVGADLHDDGGALLLVSHVDDLLHHVVGVRVAHHHLKQGGPAREKTRQETRHQHEKMSSVFIQRGVRASKPYHNRIGNGQTWFGKTGRGGYYRKASPPKWHVSGWRGGTR